MRRHILGQLVAAVTIAATVLLSGCTTRRAAKQPPTIADKEDLEAAIGELRDDDVKWNCHNAIWYLYERREEIWPTLVANLDIDDYQAQEAIMRILCETDSFKPDERFVELILERLAERGELFLRCHHSIHYDFIAYLGFIAPESHNVIAKGIGSDNMFVVWGVTYALNKSGYLDEHLCDYTPAIVGKIVDNIENRERLYAVRTCLILGDHCLPALRERSISAGSGSSAIAELLVRAIAANDREALDTIHLNYAYLWSAYLARGGHWPKGFRPLPGLLDKKIPRFLRN